MVSSSSSLRKTLESWLHAIREGIVQKRKNLTKKSTTSFGMDFKIGMDVYVNILWCFVTRKSICWRAIMHLKSPCVQPTTMTPRAKSGVHGLESPPRPKLLTVQIGNGGHGDSLFVTWSSSLVTDTYLIYIEKRKNCKVPLLRGYFHGWVHGNKLSY